MNTNKNLDSFGLAMENNKPLLRLIKVSKYYESISLDTPPTVVLDDISMELNTGGTMAIVGPSGSGKSTLLNVISTIDRANSGQIYLRDQDLSTLLADECAYVRNQKIGLIFQDHHLLPQCTALENVLLPTLAPGNKITKDEAIERATELLKSIGLENRRDHRSAQLSGGERQRVAVARALINRPELLLADEPTGALDEAMSNQIIDLLTGLQSNYQFGLITVTHSNSLAKQMDQVFKLNKGKLVKQ